MERGKFLVLEGIDGSGKSTQARLLAKCLREKGVGVELTQEHTDRSAGRLIERVLREHYLKLIDLEEGGMVIDGDREEEVVADDLIREIKVRGWV